MIDYIKENCKLEDDLICLPFNAQENANQIFRKCLEVHEEETLILAEKEAQRIKAIASDLPLLKTCGSSSVG